jgi:DnaK suppressor protein
MVDGQKYQQILLAKQQELLQQIGEARKGAEELSGDSVQDSIDESVADEQKDQQFAAADRSESLLQQVEDALRRIAAGTFGKCLVDGGPIEEKRLDAVPWTPYCLKHEQLLEKAHPAKTPSL